MATQQQIDETNALLTQGNTLGEQASQVSGLAYTPTPVTSPVTVLSSSAGQTINQENENQLNKLNSYTVQSGDTLSKIAANKGVGINDISGYRSGNPDLIYPGEVLTFGGGTASGSSMVNDINRAAAQGISDPVKLAALQKQEAAAKQALAEAEAAKNKNDPNSLDYWVNKAKEISKTYQSGLADYLKNVSSLRAQRAALSVPGAKEVELTKQVASMKNEIDMIKVKNEESKFSEYAGQTMSFAQGRANEKDIKTNFQLMQKGIELNGVLAELGIETAIRTATLDSIKESLSELKDDYTLKTQIEDKISSLEDSVVSRAQQLSTNSQNQLSKMLDLLQGVNPKDLTSDMQLKLQQLASSAGLPYDLVTQALTTQYSRQIFEDNLKLAQEQRLSNDKSTGTEAERKAQSISSYQSAFTKDSNWQGINVIGADGYIDPRVWRAAMADAPSEGLSRKDFITEFGYLINPKDLQGGGKDYGLTVPELSLITG